MSSSTIGTDAPYTNSDGIESGLVSEQDGFMGFKYFPDGAPADMRHAI